MVPGLLLLCGLVAFAPIAKATAPTITPGQAFVYGDSGQVIATGGSVVGWLEFQKVGGNSDISAGTFSPPSPFTLSPMGWTLLSSFNGTYTDVDELVADDGDFVYSQNGVRGAELNLYTGTQPGQNATTATFRYRIAKTNNGVVNGSGNAASVQITLSNASPSSNPFTFTDVARIATGAWTEYSFTFDASQINFASRFDIRIVVSTSGGSPSKRRGVGISWMILEVSSSGSATGTDGGQIAYPAPAGTVVAQARWTGNGVTPPSEWSSPETITIAQRPITLTLSGSKAFDGTPTVPAGNVSLSSGFLGGADSLSVLQTPASGIGSYTSLDTAVALIRNINSSNATASYVVSWTGTFAIVAATQAAPTVDPGQSFNYTGGQITASGGGGRGSLEFQLASDGTASGLGITTGGYLTATSDGTAYVEARWSGDGTYGPSPWSAPELVDLTSGAPPDAPVITANQSFVYGEPGQVAATGGLGVGYLEFRLGSGSIATGAAVTPGTFTSGQSFYLRPTTNVSQISFTNGFSAIDEVTADDSDFAFSANDTDARLIVGFNTPPFTPTSNPTVRFRLAKTKNGVVNGGGNAVALSVNVRQGVTSVGSGMSTTVTGSWTEYSLTINAAQVTDWGLLRLDLEVGRSYGSGPNKRGAAISWAEIEGASPSSGTNGGVVTSDSAGLVVVEARWTGDGGATPPSAWSLPETITITPRPITLTLSGSKGYDGTTAVSLSNVALSSGTLAFLDSLFSLQTTSPNPGTYTSLDSSVPLVQHDGASDVTDSYALTWSGSFAINSASQAAPTVAASQSGPSPGFYVTASGGGGNGDLEFQFSAGGTASGLNITTAGFLTATSSGTAVVEARWSGDGIYTPSPWSAPESVTITIASGPFPPVVALTSPANGSIVMPMSDVQMLATASDPDGSIARVEFFADGLLVGTATTPWSSPDTFAVTTQFSPGTHSLVARAYDLDDLYSDSNVVIVRGYPELPYVTDFESQESYQIGPLDGQLGWSSVNGVALVQSDAAASGLQSVTVPASTQIARVEQEFIAEPENVVFVDVFAKLAADEEIGLASAVETEQGRVALLRSGIQGQVMTFDGVLNNWQQTVVPTILPLDGEGRTQDWVRFTFREDFTTQTWDLYINGVLKDIDIGFRTPMSESFMMFSVSGHETSITRFDDLFIDASNPVFVDEDLDGIDDAYELANGLDPTRNDRDEDINNNGVSNVEEYLFADGVDTDGDGLPDLWELIHFGNLNQTAEGDFDGDGLTNLQEQQLGTNPTATDTDVDGMNDGWEVAYGLNPLMNDASGDFDADGVSNLLEFQLGRNPTKGAVPDSVGAVNLRVFLPTP